MKRCSACRITRDNASFYRNRSRPDGLADACRECTKTRVRSWYARDRAHARILGRASREKHRVKRLAYEHARRDRRLAYMKDWRARGAKHVAEYKRRWNAAHPEANRARVRRWQTANPERANFSKRAGVMRRRARIAGARISKADLRAVMQRDGMICHLCSLPVTRPDLSFDHLIPLSRGGPHVTDNLAVAHASSNRRRHAGRLPAQLRLVG